MTDRTPKTHDLAEGDPLTEAWRMVREDITPGAMYPYAGGPLHWTRAAVLAQVDSAASLREIAAAISGGDLRQRLVSQAAGLLDPTEPFPGNGEYRRGMTELICRTLGLTTDDFRDEIDAEITAAIR